MFAAVALDFAVFLWRQRQGDVLSFATVKQYVPIADGKGHYRYDYFGEVDISCVEALLPHEHRPPCWWVQVHHEEWE